MAKRRRFHFSWRPRFWRRGSSGGKKRNVFSRAFYAIKSNWIILIITLVAAVLIFVIYKISKATKVNPFKFVQSVLGAKK